MPNAGRTGVSPVLRRLNNLTAETAVLLCFVDIDKTPISIF